jgi:hypothetical protein
VDVVYGKYVWQECENQIGRVGMVLQLKMNSSDCHVFKVYISSFDAGWTTGCQSQRPRMVKLLFRRDLSCSLKHVGSEAAIVEKCVQCY